MDTDPRDEIVATAVSDWPPIAPGPCEIRHRTLAAATHCRGFHPTIGTDWRPPEPRATLAIGLPHPPSDPLRDFAVAEGIVGIGPANSPAAGGAEPERSHPHSREAEGERTIPRSGKDAIWKSVIGATGGWGCERETFYREVVRDQRGYRLSMGANEPMVFGAAVDRAHTLLMERRWEHGPADASLLGFDTSTMGEGIPLTEDMLWEDVGAAVRAGMMAARGRMTAEPWTDEDWKGLTDRVGLACEKLIGLYPNRMKEKMRGGETVEWLPQPEPEGTPPGPPIAWLDQTPGHYAKAQVKLFSPDVVGGRGISGKPDYLMYRGGIIIGWVDVKTLGKAGSFPAKWAAGEAVAYDYMTTVENNGILPEWHGYLEYRRVAKPYWAIVTAPVNPSVIRLARAYFDRWGRALDGNDPDGLSFSPKNCARCSYREPIPEFGFAGCPIGGPAMDVAPVDVEDE